VWADLLHATCYVLHPLQLGDGRGRHGDALDSALVPPPADPEVAPLPPRRPPAVLHGPELLTRPAAATEAHEQHGVVRQLEGAEGVRHARVVVDTPTVGHEVRVHLRGGERRGGEEEERTREEEKGARRGRREEERGRRRRDE